MFVLGNPPVIVRDSVTFHDMRHPGCVETGCADGNAAPSACSNPFVVVLPMNKAAMLRIFLRSLTIQVSFNFRTMQGLGFAFSMLPLINRGEKSVSGKTQDFVKRHLRMFSTNPYLVPAVIGSVARLEEDGKDVAEVEAVKKALMGPYAAIGDAFFYGALRLFSAVLSVLIAFSGSSYAPFAFMAIFSPPQIVVRTGGFLSGIRLGRGGFNYIRALDLPRDSSVLRYGSLIVLAVMSVALTDDLVGNSGHWQKAASVAVGSAILLFSFAGNFKEISSEKLLYGITILCMAFSFFYGYI